MQDLPPPRTIQGHAYAIYRPLAMLAGMQLGVFPPLGSGPMSAAELSKKLGVRTDKLSPLLFGAGPNGASIVRASKA